MITINDVWVTAKVTDDLDKNMTLDICYTDTDDADNINIYDIVLAIARPKIYEIKANAVSNTLRGISRFTSNNGALTKPFSDVLKLISECAESRGVAVGKLLDEYANM